MRKMRKEVTIVVVTVIIAVATVMMGVYRDTHQMGVVQGHPVGSRHLAAYGSYECKGHRGLWGE